MTKEERIEAELRKRKIDKQAKEDSQKERLAGRRRNYIRNTVGKFMDSFTLEFIIQIVGDIDMGENELGILVGVVYAVFVTFILWMLGRVCRLLPPTVGAIVYLSSDNQAYILAVLIIGWLVTRIIVLASGTRTLPQSLIVPAREVIHEKRGHLVFGWLEPMILNMFIVMGIAWAIGAYQQTLGGIVCVTIFIVLIQVVPGAGGNSTTGSVMTILLVLVSVLACPPVFSVALDFIQDKTKTSLGSQTLSPAPIPNLIAQTLAVKGDPLSVIFLDPSSYLDILRVLIGSVTLTYMILDDFKGPGALLNTVTSANTRRDINVNGAASIDRSFLWIVLASQLFIDAMCYCTLLLFIRIVGIGLAWLIWEALGRRIWVGRGLAANFTLGRAGCGVVLGDGPRGRRQLIVALAIFISGLAFLSNHMSEVGWGVMVIVILCSTTERLRAIALGILCMNLGMIGLGLYSKKPFTASMDDSTKDAHTPSVGENSG